VTQIMNLLNLAPEIQEEILILPAIEAGRDPVNERDLRRLPGMMSWVQQVERWKEIRSAQAESSA
jgi:hypothetical protein